VSADFLVRDPAFESRVRASFARQTMMQTLAAALTLCAPEMDVLAVEFKINLVAPARYPRFRATARVLRPGRTLTVCLAHVVGMSGADCPLVATMLSTIIAREAEA